MAALLPGPVLDVAVAGMVVAPREGELGLDWAKDLMALLQSTSDTEGDKRGPQQQGPLPKLSVTITRAAVVLCPAPASRPPPPQRQIYAFQRKQQEPRGPAPLPLLLASVQRATVTTYGGSDSDAGSGQPPDSRVQVAGLAVSVGSLPGLQQQQQQGRGVLACWAPLLDLLDEEKKSFPPVRRRSSPPATLPGRSTWAPFFYQEVVRRLVSEEEIRVSYWGPVEGNPWRLVIRNRLVLIGADKDLLGSTARLQEAMAAMPRRPVRPPPAPSGGGGEPDETLWESLVKSAFGPTALLSTGSTIQERIQQALGHRPAAAAAQASSGGVWVGGSAPPIQGEEGAEPKPQQQQRGEAPPVLEQESRCEEDDEEEDWWALGEDPRDLSPRDTWAELVDGRPLQGKRPCSCSPATP